MAQDLEREVNNSSSLSVKERVTYRSYVLWLYFASKYQSPLGFNERKNYEKSLNDMTLPQRLNFLKYLMKDSAVYSHPLVDYFKLHYISIDGGKKDDAGKTDIESDFFHSRALVLIK